MSEQDDRDRYRYLQLKAKAAGQSSGSAPEQGFFQKAAQMAQAPLRAARGIPTVIADTLAGTGMDTAMLRGYQATQPGYKPQGIAENLAQIGGESIPLSPLGGALGSGGKIAQLVKAGGVASGLSALTQTAEEGAPTPGRTALAGALGMAPVAAMQGLKGVFPYIAGKFTKIPSAAYEVLTTAFKKAYPGTPEAIDAQAGKVTPALEDAYGTLNKRLQGRKEFMGMNMSTKEAMAEAEATGGEPRSVGRIVREFKDMQRNSAPVTEKQVPSQLVGPNGEPLTKTIIERGIPKGEKLRRLNDMAIDINKQTQGSYTTDVLQTKKGIEGEAFKTGGTSYRIFNKFKQQWGKLKEIESDLGANLSDPTSAGAEVERLVRKSIEKPAALTGNDARKFDALERLERTTGKQIIEPLKKQILSQYTNNPLSDYVPKGMLGKLLLMHYWPEGIAAFAMGSPKVMGGVAQTLNNPAGPASQAARTVVPTLINRALNQFRGQSAQQ